MSNIIKADLFRILKGKALYISILVICLISFVSIILMQQATFGVVTTSVDSDMLNTEKVQKLAEAKNLKEYRNVIKSFGAFELDKQIIGGNINLYYLFIAIVVIAASSDFSNGTIKNSLSSAISRRNYYFSKLILCLGLGTALILFNNYFTHFLNLLVNGKEFASSFIEISKITLYQMPLLWGVISLLVCMCFLFQKTALFNGIAIPFIMVIQLVVMGVGSLLRLKMDWYNKYELQSALANLVNDPTTSYILKCVLLGLGYIIIFNIIGYCLFRKTEVK
jgi:hypothetical protein